MGSTKLTSANISINGIASPSESFIYSPAVESPQSSGMNSAWRIHDSSRNMIHAGTRADSNGGLMVESDRYGNLLWSSYFKDNQSYFSANPGCVDSSGNIYVPLNQYNGTSPKVGVAKFNSSGVFQFQRTMTVTANASNGGYGFGSIVDNSGNFYVFGSARESGSSQHYPYVVKFDSAGNTSWQARLNVSSLSSLDAYYGKGCGAVLSDGSIVLSGNYWTSGAGTDANNLLVRYDTNGTLLWQKAFSAGTNVTQYASGLTIDSSNNIYCLVQSQESPAPVFLIKYNSSGTLQWQRRISRSGVSINGPEYSICTAPDGNIVIAFAISDLGILILTYNQSGVLQWAKKLLVRSGSVSLGVQGVSIDNGGYLHIGVGHTDFTNTSGNASTVVKVPYGNLTKDLNGSIVKFGYQYITSTGEITDAAGSGNEPSITFASGNFSSPYTYSGTPGNNNNISVQSGYFPAIIRASLS